MHEHRNVFASVRFQGPALTFIRIIRRMMVNLYIWRVRFEQAVTENDKGGKKEEGKEEKTI